MLLVTVSLLFAPCFAQRAAAEAQPPDAPGAAQAEVSEPQPGRLEELEQRARQLELHMGELRSQLRAAQLSHDELLTRTTTIATSVSGQATQLKQLDGRVEQVDRSLERTAETARAADAAAAAATRTATEARSTASKASDTAKRADDTGTVSRSFLHRIWILIAAALVFFMQAGFKCLDVGLGRRRFDGETAVMNLMTWLVLCVAFYFSFNWMFGPTTHGLISLDVFRMLGEGSFSDGTALNALYHPLGLEFFLLQLAFAATAATIVDGAISERTTLPAHCCLVVGIAVFIYPVFGHWAWNPGGWLRDMSWFTWLQELSGKKIGFHDFAGSTVVHSVGAWISLVGAYCVGPRRFRFQEAHSERFAPYSRSYAILGVIILWFGWWGFNGGGQLRYDVSIARIILNTNLAGACAGLVAYLHAQSQSTNVTDVHDKLIGGVLGGLVSITAACDVVPPWGAMLIGASAGLLHNWVFDRLKAAQLDDVAGAIPVHGACGVFGTWCATFGVIDGSVSGYQFIAQLLGSSVALLFTCISSALLFLSLDRFMGLRPRAGDELPRALALRAATLPAAYTGGYRVSRRRGNSRWRGWSRFVPVQDLPPRVRESLDRDLSRIQVLRDDDSLVTDPFEIKRVVARHPVFICYGGADVNAKLLAQALPGRLKTKFNLSAFFDEPPTQVEASFSPGALAALETCHLFVVVIDADWNRDGRLANPADRVARELRFALDRGVNILPVLVGHAAMPDAASLPPELAAVTDYEAATWRLGYTDLDDAIRLALGDALPVLVSKRAPLRLFRSFCSTAFGGLAALFRRASRLSPAVPAAAH